MPRCNSSTVTLCKIVTVSLCHCVNVWLCQDITWPRCHGISVSLCQDVMVPKSHSVILWPRFKHEITTSKAVWFCLIVRIKISANRSMKYLSKRLQVTFDRQKIRIILVDIEISIVFLDFRLHHSVVGVMLCPVYCPRAKKLVSGTDHVSFTCCREASWMLQID
jgi:hypothetical protein